MQICDVTLYYILQKQHEQNSSDRTVVATAGAAASATGTTRAAASAVRPTRTTETGAAASAVRTTGTTETAARAAQQRRSSSAGQMVSIFIIRSLGNLYTCSQRDNLLAWNSVFLLVTLQGQDFTYIKLAVFLCF